MISLLKSFYQHNEILSNNIKDNIVKYNRRIKYFFLVIPLMFIVMGYSIESIVYKDYTKFKLFHRFTRDFIFKVNLNIFPITIAFVSISILLVSMYKPNLIRAFWASLLSLGSLYAFIPKSEDYVVEFLYQVNIFIKENYLLTLVTVVLIYLSLITISKTKIIKLTVNGLEIFFLTSILYLEITGHYELFYFIKTFFSLFVNSVNLFSNIWGIVVTSFIVMVFLSLYNKKAMSLIFFIKNKVEVKRKLNHVNKFGELSSMEIVKVSDKMKMPLLRYESLPYVGVVVPAFNESTTINSTIESLLNVDYDKEKLSIFIVSDGSTDNYKHLILIDKPNGGKADALNLGLEYLPQAVNYMSVIDADSVVDKYSFRILATKAEADPNIAELAGTILPRQHKKGSGFKSLFLTNVQLFDYLSSFHGERGSLSLLNTILVVPGAFGFFRKDVLLELKGYPQNVLAEDGVLTINIHRKKKYSIGFIPEAVSYTQVPSTFADLRKQRIRWFKGLTELLVLIKSTWKENPRLTLVFLDYLLIEWITPLMIPIGLAIIVANPLIVTYPLFYSFMLLSIITPIIQGLLCFLMESSYRKVELSKLIYLPLILVISPFMTLWRNDALLDLRNRSWGRIKRY